MSRNKNRLDASGLMDMPADAEPPSPNMVQPQSSMDMGWTTPTEMVDLPSQGRYYPPDHPLYNISEIEIRHMTAKDEDILTNRSLLRKGLALDRLIESVIVDKRVKADSLLLGDKNALLIASRITAYGPEYSTSITCPSCTKVQNYEFDLEDVGFNNAGTAENSSGVHPTDSGTFIINLPISDVDIEVRFLTGQDQRRLTQEMERKRKRKIDSAAFTDQLKSFIVSVDGDEDKLSLQQFIVKMPARDARFLRQRYSELMPDMDLTQEFVCDSCGHEADVEVPLTSNFFWPDW